MRYNIHARYHLNSRLERPAGKEDSMPPAPHSDPDNLPPSLAGDAAAQKIRFGHLLAELRTSVHLTQKQAAELFAVGDDGYSHYEHGRRSPDRERVVYFLRKLRLAYPQQGVITAGL